MPKVSIIMGVYNCKDKGLLKKSVESIINQSFSDWEFLICDDGSTDDTLQLLKEIQKQDDRIIILNYEQNHGLAYALNFCIENTRGMYIARQDDDDFSYAERLQEEVEYLDNHLEVAFVGCRADVYGVRGIWGDYDVPEYPQKKDFLWNNPFNHPTILVRKDKLMELGGYRVTKRTRRCEDYDLFMRMYAKGYQGYNIQKKLYKYWIEEDSTKKYRPMKYRIDEAIIRFHGYKKMGILWPGIIYSCKPILIGLIPQCVFRKIRKKQYNK